MKREKEPECFGDFSPGVEVCEFCEYQEICQSEYYEYFEEEYDEGWEEEG